MPLSGLPLAEPFEPAKILRQGVESGRDRLALGSMIDHLTWEELDQWSDRVARGYLRLGLRPGDRVASLMPNRTALLVHYLACIKAGLTATPLNYRYTPPEIDHALGVSEAVLLLAHAERNADLANCKRVAGLPLGTIRYGGDDRTVKRWEDLMLTEDESREPPPPDPKSPAIIYFTSGSTGKPKGVTHSFETLGWMIASVIRALEITPRDVVVPGSSHSHIGGMLLALASLAAGATVIIPRTFDGEELLPLFRTHRPTLLCMLPAALFGLVRDHGAKQEDFASLRLCISGGDKVSAELEHEFTKLSGFAIDEVYGMTEIGYTTVNPPSGVNKIGSIGKACPGYSLAIRDDDGKELGAGDVGRLLVRSPTNMVGYWNNAAATAETICDGWLDTGDLVTVDEDGYVWFRGRKKQIIVHDGSNICPQEVEEVLMEHPAIAEAGVVGVHDLLHGENVRAYLTLRPGASRPTDQELIQFARARVGYKAPAEIVFLDQMPLNPTGKVDRTALKARSETATIV